MCNDCVLHLFCKSQFWPKTGVCVTWLQQLSVCHLAAAAVRPMYALREAQVNRSGMAVGTVSVAETTTPRDICRELMGDVYINSSVVPQLSFRGVVLRTGTPIVVQFGIDMPRATLDFRWKTITEQQTIDVMEKFTAALQANEQEIIPQCSMGWTGPLHHGRSRP